MSRNKMLADIELPSKHSDQNLDVSYYGEAKPTEKDLAKKKLGSVQ